MKWSSILHGVAATAGVLGVLSLLGAWIAAANDGSFLWFSEEHAFNSAKTLLLVSIAFGVGTLIHQQQEKK